MSNDNETTETPEVEETSADAPVQGTQYAIHSLVRKAAHRTHRAQQPAAIRKKQYLANGTIRLIPERRFVVSEEVLMKNLPELRAKAAEHILEVRTMDGRIVDLSTLKAGSVTPAPLLPHPKLDSVADDTPTGMYIPPYVGDDGSMPAVLQPGEKPALFTKAAMEFGDGMPPAAPAEGTPPALDDAAVDAAVAAAQAESTEDTGHEEGAEQDEAEEETAEAPAAAEEEHTSSEEPQPKATKGKKKNR